MSLTQSKDIEDKNLSDFDGHQQYTETHTHKPNRAIGLMCRVFANGPETGVQSQVESYQRLKNGTCLTLSILW